MASTEALHPQNLNRNRPKSSRNTKNDVSLEAAPASKSCRLPSGGPLSKQGDENRDPNAQARSTKAVERERRAGVSRLPVPVKSQRLVNKPDFCRTQKTLGESSKVNVQKKSRAKTVPFSLSQTEASKTAGCNQKETLMSMKLETLPSAPFPARCPGKLPSSKPFHLAQCPTAPKASDPASVGSSVRVERVVSEPTSEPSESAHMMTPRPAHQSSQEVRRGEAGLVPSTRLKPAAPSGASSRHIAGSAEPFCPDPSALHSILHNEGIKTGVPANMPQRVSVLRSEHGTGAKAGSMLHFSPDAVALLSILQNKGIRTGEGPAATPHTSACPTVRGSSVYLPQRVLVTKSRAGPLGVLAGSGTECSQSPAMRWTPQRVPNTRPQSMRRLLSSHRTPIFRNTPKMKGVQGCSQELEAHKEENIVQRLFEDAEQEEEPSSSLGLSGQQSGKEMQDDGLAEQQVVPSAVLMTDGDNRGKDSQRAKVQPFVQAAHRGSVIVFAQTKKALSTPSAEERPGVSQAALEPATLEPRTWKQESAQVMDQQQRNGHFVQPFPWQSLRATGAGTSRPAHPTQHRLQPLGEVLLDEECATYTSRQPSSAAQLHRCSNPVASTLDFRDSTCFVPIVLPPLLPLSPSPSDSDTTVSGFNLIIGTLGQDLTVE